MKYTEGSFMSRKSKLVIAVLLTFLGAFFCVPSLAQEGPEMLDVPMFGSCIDYPGLCVIRCESGGDTLSPSQCLQEQIGMAEKALNATYSKVMALAKKFGENLPDHLKHSELAWLELRKRNCDFHQRMTRTTDNYSQYRCLLVMTRQRTLELGEVKGRLSFLE
jgi:uncharacterized protein YecT (DUF1311 family)